jgi:4-amino-4-deoxy-L-arabinose transferase-like glycosyltransferase
VKPLANPAATSSRWTRRLWIAAFAVGLLLRLLFLSNTSSLDTKIVDEQHFARLAGHVLMGDGLAWEPGELTSVRPPLYPAFVAAIWKVSGFRNLQAVRIVQIVLAMLTAFAAYEIGRLVYSREVGRTAAAIVWLYPNLMFFNFTILTETLFTLLLACFVWLSIKLVQQRQPLVALLSGLALGLATLTRSALWPLPVLLCPLLALLIPHPARARLLLPVLVFVGYAAMVGPWAYRNTRLQGVFTVVDTMGGMNLRIGNYEYTPDTQMWDAVGLQGEQNWSYALTQEHPGEKLTEGQKDKWAQRKAVEYIVAHPGTTLRRAVIKFADFWGLEREFAAGIRFKLYHPPYLFSLAASVVIVLAYIVTVSLGSAGIWLTPPDLRLHVVLLLPIVMLMSVHSLAFGHSRYHVPLIPILAVYAAAFLNQRRPIAWSSRPAVAGAALTMGILATIWIRQVFFVDSSLVRTFVALVS